MALFFLLGQIQKIAYRNRANMILSRKKNLMKNFNYQVNQEIFLIVGALVLFVLFASLHSAVLVSQLPRSGVEASHTSVYSYFIFIIFIQLRLECIKYIKYGTSSMQIFVKKLDKIVDCWFLHATSPGLGFLQ